MSELPEHVQNAIENVREGRSTRLDLQGWSMKLQEIHEEIFALSELEELDLSVNEIRFVPDRLGDLTKLREVNLAHNPVERVPDVPGLHLDWHSYLRCERHLSPLHVVGLYFMRGKRPIS
jgi:hypothetical protein